MVKRRYNTSRDLGGDNLQHIYLLGHHFLSGCPPRPLNNVILEIPFFLLSFSCGVFVSSGPLSKFDWVKKSFFFQILKALIHSQLLVLLFEKTKSISYFVSLLSCKNLSVSSASLFHHQGLGLYQFSSIVQLYSVGFFFF